MMPYIFPFRANPQCTRDAREVTQGEARENLTGLTMATGYELAGKRLELLKDMVGGSFARGGAQQSRQSAAYSLFA
jgi:hypothetical protein